MEHQTWIGRSLNGRYKIEALLGQGGMSAVYKAFDPNLKRVVAVKLIHPHLLQDEDFIGRFKREAAAVASLRHPNIVQVYDFNNDGEVYYMVMEFVPGETLQDQLKHLKKSERRMSIDQACRYIINICDALGYAHRLGMIHRDIKPANIMLDVRGQAILMDFGIVKMLDATTHTTTGAVLGTARYMSPEVIRSEMPDERSDLYSLGIVFYEMLSGEPPFDADSAMSLLMRHLNDPVPSLNAKRDDVPEELARIVNKALEKDRNDRYRTADDMVEDIKRFLSKVDTAPIPTVLPLSKVDPAIAETKVAAVAATPKPVEQPKLQAAEAAQAEKKPSSIDGVPKANDSKQQATAQKPRSPILRYGVIGIVVLCLCATSLGVLNRVRMNNQRREGTPTVQSVEATPTLELVVAVQQSTQTDATETLSAPAATPTDTLVPLTATPTTPYVLITGIHLENDKYVVDYEVHNFPESPSLHVHMFFNTVPPEQAGSPGAGPWKLTWGKYGDPPFTQYGPANRPERATQMCALVANPNHSVNLNSGNCIDLP